MKISLRHILNFFKEESALTVIEISVVMFIMSTISVSATAGFSDMSHKLQTTNAIAQFEYDIKRARNQALMRGTRVIFSVDKANNTYTLGYDNFPYNNTSTIEEEIVTRTFPVSLSPDQNELFFFDAQGFLTDEFGDMQNYNIQFTNIEGGNVTMDIYPVGNVDVS